ncbi:MAG: hypothetical protein ACXAD7_06665 [Candidatus Kariarchaeaceae archaeon]
MVNSLLFIAGIIFLIPMLIQLRNYFWIRSTSYLNFALLFVFIIIDAMISAFNPEIFMFEVFLTISFVGTFFILLKIASEIINNKLPVQDQSWQIYSIVVLLFTIVIKYLIYQSEISDEFTSLRIAFGETLELLTGIMIIYAFRKVKLIVETKRTLRIKSLWLFIGFILMTIGMIRILTYSFDFAWEVFDGGESSTIESLIENVETITTIGVLLMALTAFAFTIFYPETLLLSEVQIYKVVGLYQLMEDLDASKQSFSFYTDTIILDYLNSIPNELLEPSNPE